MKNKRTRKILLSVLIMVISIFLFIDQCTTINLTTADLFRPPSFKKLKTLSAQPQSKNYEIVAAKGSFPVLYDRIRNEFYVANLQGLSKYDSLGNLMFSKNLEQEKYTSVFHFMNYAPYVFTKEGVYDFSGNNLKYSSFKTIQNLKGDLNPEDFDHIFEKYYKEAEVVLYDYEIEVDTSLYARPMYFNIKKEWFLLFAPKDEYRFSHDNNNSIENDIIGQIDFLNFPAKFSDKRLIVLKDEKSGSYSINGKGQIIDDEYLTTYFTQILYEKKYNYQTEDQIKIISRKKEEYYFMGSFLDLPDWIAPSFINTAYFRLSYQDEDLYFQEKAIKYFSKLKTSNNFYLYELPKQLRTKSNVAFLYYNLDIGGYRNDSTNLVEPIIKNTGLYIIKPKKTFRK